MRWIIALAAMAVATAGFASDVGQIKNVSGTVHIERGTLRAAATPGMHLRQSDTVVTGADGAVGVTFLDNSLVSLGPDSVLVIDQYVFDSTTHAGKFDANLKKGTLAVVSGKMVKQSPDAMKVRTPSSIMGVRGTEFAVQVGQPSQ